MINLDRYFKNDDGPTEFDNLEPCYIFKERTGKTDCNVNNACKECIMANIKWLLEECKEPLLTDEAKKYLKSIVRLSKCIDIQKTISDDSYRLTYKLICVTDDGIIEFLYYTGTKYDEYFKNMELDKTILWRN